MDHVLKQIGDYKRGALDVTYSKDLVHRMPEDERIVFWRTGKIPDLKTARYVRNFPEEPFFSADMYDSLAIVGNSGSLLHRKWGKEIDGHDTVFRFNTARTKGYEEHVGSIRGFRFSIGTLRNGNAGETLLRSYRKKSQPPRDMKNGMYDKPASEFMVLSHRISQFAQSLKKDSKGKVCSTGFLGVVIALLISKKVTLYGFDLPSQHGIEFDYHYYDHVKYVEKSHNFLREQEIYSYLQERYDGFEHKKVQ